MDQQRYDGNFAKKFADIVGLDHFYDAAEILEAYSRDHSFVPQRNPLAVIKPANTEEIKSIIDLANETLISLIPVSSGFPKFHGDTVPSYPGIVVDLSGLNQILRVDRRNKAVALEPGVTFGQLRQSLEEHGMVPYTPLLPRSTKSVITSALEREPILIPRDHWHVSDPFAGGQVVLGDGHVQGFGDTAGWTKDHVKNGTFSPVYPMGPGNIGWLEMIQGSQGTLGIVPWAVMRCRLKPAIQRPLMLAGSILQAFLGFTQKMLKRRFVDELFVINAFGLASVITEGAEAIREVRANLPLWTLFVNICAYTKYPEQELEWKEEQVRQVAQEEGLEVRDSVGACTASSLLRILATSADTDRRLRFKSACQVLPFSTTLDRTPELTDLISKVAGEYGYPSADISLYLQPVIQGCGCDCEVAFPYQPEDKEELARVKELFVVGAQKMNKAGAYYSRPYSTLANITYRDTEVTNILRKIKGMMDPNGILNIGKLCF